MKDLGHGANVEQIARMYNKNPKDIIDFSSNINPNVIQGLEEYILEGLQESRSYPDIKYTNLRNNISQYIECKTRIYNTWKWSNWNNLLAYEKYR